MIENAKGGQCNKLKENTQPQRWYIIDGQPPMVSAGIGGLTIQDMELA